LVKPIRPFRGTIGVFNIAAQPLRELACWPLQSASQNEFILSEGENTMKLRSLFVVCCILVGASSILGQTGSSADPISGQWKGYLGPGAAPQVPIVMDLKFDNKSAVSGSLVGLPSPGDVKTGTFDPKTGVMKLQMGITGQPVVRLVLEGTIVKGVGTGTVQGDNQTGTFMITKVGEVSQGPGTQNATLELRQGFTEVSTWVSKAADMVPAEKYNYKPVDTVRSFGQIIAHVTDSYNYFCARGAGNKVEWSDATEKGSTDKATLVPKLKQALDKCNAAYGSDNGQVGPLLSNIGHTSLHYGNIITYMRMLGLKPPSS
jgi:hypothetical protein